MRRYRVAAAEAERTMGQYSGGRFDALARLADLLSRRGERGEADRIFQQLNSQADRADTPRDKAMLVEENYGAALVAGRPPPRCRCSMRRWQWREQPHDVTDLPRIQQALGEAEEQLGRRAAAGPLLAAARTAWMGEGPANAPWVLGALARPIWRDWR